MSFKIRNDQNLEEDIHPPAVSQENASIFLSNKGRHSSIGEQRSESLSPNPTQNNTFTKKRKK